MTRDNETWLRHLIGNGPDQQAALSDLRAVLLRGLRRGLHSDSRIDDSFLEDVVQDSLLRVLDRLDQFQGRSQFVTWATSVAIRVAVTELRRRRWKDVSLEALLADADFTPDRTVDGALGPAARWQQSALIDKLYDVIHRELTEKQRTVLLAELKGMPLEDIARHIGSNRNAVYKLTYDARKSLKRGLEAAGYVAADFHTAFAG